MLSCLDNSWKLGKTQSNCKNIYLWNYNLFKQRGIFFSSEELCDMKIERSFFADEIKLIIQRGVIISKIKWSSVEFSFPLSSEGHRVTPTKKAFHFVYISRCIWVDFRTGWKLVIDALNLIKQSLTLRLSLFSQVQRWKKFKPTVLVFLTGSKFDVI